MANPTHNLIGRCPFCTHAFEAATGVTGEAAPDNGDFTICIACGEWAVFDATAPGKLRKPSDGEYTKIAADPVMSRMHGIWKDSVEAKRRIDEGKLHTFPSFEHDFEIGVQEYIDGELDAYQRHAFQLFFFLGAYCMILRLNTMKGMTAATHFAVKRMEKELSEWLSQEDEPTGDRPS